jgi:hypothetical protein
MEAMEKIRVCVCYGYDGDDQAWRLSLEKQVKVEARYVNICRHDWKERIKGSVIDVLVFRPPGVSETLKNIFDQRMSLLYDNHRGICFPTKLELELYENKKYLADWLGFNSVEHACTNILVSKREALLWLNESKFPLVAKTNIGASGRGVCIIKDLVEGKSYVKKVFSGGVKPNYMPKLWKGSIVDRIKRMLDNGYLKKRISVYSTLKSQKQDYCIFQEYIEHDYEWRVVAIGESYFAHKKLKEKDKASGTLLKDYSDPPLSLLDFVRGIVTHYGFWSSAFDVFESSGKFYINEIQTYFGQSDAYQMKVGGIIGRYTYNGSWHFQPGDFNRNQSYDLRLDAILDRIANKDT